MLAFPFLETFPTQSLYWPHRTPMPCENPTTFLSFNCLLLPRESGRIFSVCRVVLRGSCLLAALLFARRYRPPSSGRAARTWRLANVKVLAPRDAARGRRWANGLWRSDVRGSGLPGSGPRGWLSRPPAPCSHARGLHPWIGRRTWSASSRGVRPVALPTRG